jgi:predicted DNA-binding ArsR family transcriptional regulator
MRTPNTNQAIFAYSITDLRQILPILILSPKTLQDTIRKIITASEMNQGRSEVLRILVYNK